MITVYSMNGCAACVSAVNLLKANNVEHEVVKIDESPEAWNFLKSEGHRSMPQIYKEGKLFVEGGFTGLQKALKEGKL